MKNCSECGRQKDLSEFYKARAYKDGVMGRCKVCVLAYNKEYAKKNRTAVSQYLATYKIANRDILNDKQRVWRSHTKYFVNRYNSDLQFKLKHTLRTRLRKAIKSKKGGSAIEELGCTISELKFYLESQFQIGMSWENWSSKGWHIDHIRPLNSFDLSDPEQVRIACHYSNLQPLWASENIRKGDK
jgi:hypothetical protein